MRRQHPSASSQGYKENLGVQKRGDVQKSRASKATTADGHDESPDLTDLTLRIFRAYAVPWCAYQWVRFQSPTQPVDWVCFQAPLVALAIVSALLQWRCSPRCLAAAMLANVITILYHYPVLIDMDHWALYTDLACLVFILLADSSHIHVEHVIVGNVVTCQLVWFYAAAGVWKLSYDFWNPQLSCSGLFLVQILCGWLPYVHPALLNDTLISNTIRFGPHITCVVELAIPACLYLGQREECPGPQGWSSAQRFRRFGVMLALALHFGIVVCPLPLSIGDFSAMCASRLFWVLPEPAADAVDEMLCRARRSCWNGYHQVAFSGAILVVCSVMLTVICNVHEAAASTGPFAHKLALSGGRSGWQQWKPSLCFLVIMTLLIRALWLDVRIQSARVVSFAGQQRCTQMKQQGGLLPFFSRGFILAAAVYAFGLPMLGLIDVGACHMFANLKLHGGSNHPFLPTGLLQQWLSLEMPSTHWAGGFAGGVVRVEYTDSRFFNGVFPGEVAHISPEPHVRAKLRTNGHVGRIFKQGVSAWQQGLRGWTEDMIPKEYVAVASNLSNILPWEANKLMNGNKQQHAVIHSLTERGVEFTKYTLPANELRICLEGARRLGEAFVLEYTQIRENKGLPPGDGVFLDELWRAQGCGRAVTLREGAVATQSSNASSPLRKRTCHVRDTCSANLSVATPCAPDELALLPSPGFWSKKLVMSNPYPILNPPGRYCGMSG